MHRQKCYDTCRRYFGKVVRIEDIDGRIHLGKIIDVTKDSVWIEPMQQHSSFDTGFGYYDAYANGGCDLCGGLS
ncbi:keratin, partial [Bacillus cereus]